MTVARLDVGQRVFVLRDESDGEIGEWGTVVRLQRLADGAWVNLDKRHDRCPFPAHDPRGAYVLTYADRCSSFVPDAGGATDGEL